VRLDGHGVDITFPPNTAETHTANANGASADIMATDGAGSRKPRAFVLMKPDEPSK
jgi:hypothetical protein